MFKCFVSCCFRFAFASNTQTSNPPATLLLLKPRPSIVASVIWGVLFVSSPPCQRLEQNSQVAPLKKMSHSRCCPSLLCTLLFTEKPLVTYDKMSNNSSNSNNKSNLRWARVECAAKYAILKQRAADASRAIFYLIRF